MPAFGDEIHVVFSEEVSKKPLTGRLYVLMDHDTNRKRLYEPDPERKQPFLARNFKDWRPGETLVIDRRSLQWPVHLEQLKGPYIMNAVLDIDTTERSFWAPGNGYSGILSWTFDDQRDETVHIRVDRVVEPRGYQESERQKEVCLKSACLSDFHKRPVYLRAAVVLPPSYFNNTAVRFPAVYTIPGYGGRHYHVFMGEWTQKRYGMNGLGMEKVFVVLDPNFPTGHHCFADSENNGPWGKALTEELIPYIEKKFRLIPDAGGRLLTGQSSGGWTSLWLQVTYPRFFGGTFAVSPDPVDFRDFLGVNLYEPGANMFYLENGGDRPLGREKGKIIFTWKEVSAMETVLGEGGFLSTFEAVFSRRKEGRPQPLWDRRTGRVDRNVVEDWKKYDLRLVLERNWDKLKSLLAGKLHVYVAEDDTVFLDQPVKLLKKSMTALESDAHFVILPSGGHGDGVWKQVIHDIHQRMDRVLLDAHPELKVLPTAPSESAE